jgi:hypothetical protein
LWRAGARSLAPRPGQQSPLTDGRRGSPRARTQHRAGKSSGEHARTDTMSSKGTRNSSRKPTPKAGQLGGQQATARARPGAGRCSCSSGAATGTPQCRGGIPTQRTPLASGGGTGRLGLRTFTRTRPQFVDGCARSSHPACVVRGVGIGSVVRRTRIDRCRRVEGVRDAHEIDAGGGWARAKCSMTWGWSAPPVGLPGEVAMPSLNEMILIAIVVWTSAVWWKTGRGTPGHYFAAETGRRLPSRISPNRMCR